VTVFSIERISVRRLSGASFVRASFLINLPKNRPSQFDADATFEVRFLPREPEEEFGFAAFAREMRNRIISGLSG
jgi:hypothetical protein